jgi:hypothetical protein
VLTVTVPAFQQLTINRSLSHLPPQPGHVIGGIQFITPQTDIYTWDIQFSDLVRSMDDLRVSKFKRPVDGYGVVVYEIPTEGVLLGQVSSGTVSARLPDIPQRGWRVLDNGDGVTGELVPVYGSDSESGSDSGAGGA